jgi:hypothetical protein
VTQSNIHYDLLDAVWMGSIRNEKNRWQLGTAHINRERLISLIYLRHCPHWNNTQKQTTTMYSRGALKWLVDVWFWVLFQWGQCRKLIDDEKFFALRSTICALALRVERSKIAIANRRRRSELDGLLQKVEFVRKCVRSSFYLFLTTKTPTFRYRMEIEMLRGSLHLAVNIMLLIWVISWYPQINTE